jgi:hypothetical protein
MVEKYWESLYFSIFFILISAVAIILLTVLRIKKVPKINNLGTFCGILCMIIVLLSSMKEVYEVMQDYDMVISGEYEEEDMILIDYLRIYRDLDGNGQISYSEPKFYIPSKDEYIVLYLTDLEIGKTYRIRYYPNCKIAEVLYCVDDMNE